MCVCACVRACVLVCVCVRAVNVNMQANQLFCLVGSGDIVVLPASRTSEEPDAKALVALRREARGADSDMGSRASMTPGKMLLQEVTAIVIFICALYFAMSY